MIGVVILYSHPTYSYDTGNWWSIQLTTEMPNCQIKTMRGVSSGH